MVLSLRLSGAAGLVLLGCTAGSPSDASNTPGDDSPAPTGITAIEAEPEQGPAAPELAPADEALELGGVALGLVAAECTLTAEAGGQRLVHRFEFPAECRFSTDSSGAVRIVATDAGPAIIVEASKPLAQGCDTATRVVVITEQGPRVSKAVQRVAMCAPFEWDEMMFHVLASEPVEFGTPGLEP